MLYSWCQTASLVNFTLPDWTVLAASESPVRTTRFFGVGSSCGKAPRRLPTAKLLPSKPSWCSYHPILWHQHRERRGCHLETDKTHRGTDRKISKLHNEKATKNVHYGGDLCFLRFLCHKISTKRFEVEYFCLRFFWCQGLIFNQTQFQVTIRQRLGVDAVCRITGLAREDAVQQISGTMVMADYRISHELKSRHSISLHIPLSSSKSHILDMFFLEDVNTETKLVRSWHLEVWIQLF